MYERVLSLLPQARRYQHYAIGLCPFHADQHPSLLVTEKWFKCLACGRRGSLRTLLAALNPADPRLTKPIARAKSRNIFPLWENKAALESMLADAHTRLVQSESLRAWLKRRGIEQMLIRAELGWCRNWFTIPFRDRDGQLLGAAARAGTELSKRVPNKMTTPCGQPPLLYVPDWVLWVTAPAVYITFGLIDAISLVQLGYAAASPSAGQNSTNPRWLDDVQKPIYVVPDKGELSAAIKLATALGYRGRVLELEYPEGLKDPNDYLQVGQSELLKKHLEEAKQRDASRRTK